MAYDNLQANVTLVIPQRYLEILKKHVVDKEGVKGERGDNNNNITSNNNLSSLKALISSGCVDYRIRVK